MTALEHPAMHRWILFLVSAFLTNAACNVPVRGDESVNESATILVAAHDAASTSRSSAKFIADGLGDQEEINAAIRALPKTGGTVQLSEGTFDIRRIPGKLGGILIERSHVVLAGSGTATRLIQAPEQETNVIRIIGDGVGHVTIRDLYIDANSDANPLGAGDTNVSHARFEFCGIKAYCREPGQSGGDDVHHITIRNCHLVNARRLGIMLEGSGMKVQDNFLGNAGSDVVEILTGPGQISGNYAEITGRTHVAFGSDRGNNIMMVNNTIHVKQDGDLDIGFRSWAGSKHHVVSGNVIRVDPDGKMGLAMDIRGTETTISSNTIHNLQNASLPLKISAGNAIVTGNVFEHVTLSIDDPSADPKPVFIHNNVLENSHVVVSAGLVNPEVPETRLERTSPQKRP